MKRIKTILLSALAILCVALAAPAVVLVGGGGYEDTFNRTDEDPLSQGGQWTTVAGYQDAQVTSNQLRGTESASYARAYRTTGFGNDVFSEWQYKSGTATFGLIVRYSTATTYRYELVGNESAGDFYLRKVYSGGTVTIWDSGGRTWSADDTVRLWVKGNSQKVFLNGSLQTTQSDTDVPSGDYSVVLSVFGDNTYLDNWKGGVAQ